MKNFAMALFMSAASSLLAQVPNIQWQKCYGGPGYDSGQSVCQTSDGGYVTVGYIEASGGDISTAFQNPDCWVMKTDASGALQWQKTFGSIGADIGYCIRQTSDGGYIIAGSTTSNDSSVPGNHGDNDYWVLKLDASGSLQWQKTYGGSGLDISRSVEPTSDGGYIMAGTSQSNNGDVASNKGMGDYWIIKLSSTGTIQWQNTLGGSGDDVAYFIQPTSDGGYIATGMSGSNDVDVTGSHGDSDCWVVKLSSTGALQWQKALGGSSSDMAACIRQTNDGGYIVAGSASSTNGDITFSHNQTGTPYTLYDCWIVKLDAAGSLQWQKTYGGSHDDEATAIHQTSDGGYIVSALSSSPNDGDVTGNSANYIYDYWVLKLAPNGVLLWQKSMGGTSADYGYDVITTSDGGYMLAGKSQSNNGNVSGNHGDYDYWLVKLDNTGAVAGIKDYNADAALPLYPNPASSEVTVSWQYGNASYSIVDAAGHCVGSGTIAAGQTQLQLNGLASGLYLLRVSNGSHMAAAKLVKK